MLLGCESEIDCADSIYAKKDLLSLFDSNQVEQLVFGSLLVGDAPTGEDTEPGPVPPAAGFLERAYALDAKNELLLQRLVTWCADQAAAQSKLCGVDPEQWLLDLDANNGAYWLQLSQHQFTQGKTDDALDALKQVGHLPHFSFRWGEQLSAFTDITTALSNRREPCNYLWASGVTSSMTPRFSSLFAMCRSNLGNDAWESTCIETGETMESRAKGLLSVKIGMAIQQIAHESRNDREAVEAVAQRGRTLDALEARYSAVEACIVDDRENWRIWLRDIIKHGEVETMRLTVQRSPFCPD